MDSNKNSLLSEKIVIDWLYHSRDPRLYSQYSPTIRLNSGELLVISIIKDKKEGNYERKK